MRDDVHLGCAGTRQNLVHLIPDVLGVSRKRSDEAVVVGVKLVVTPPVGTKAADHRAEIVGGTAVAVDEEYWIVLERRRGSTRDPAERQLGGGDALIDA